MNNYGKKLGVNFIISGMLLALFLCSITLAAISCQSQDGPAEKMGESIDNKIEDTQNAVEKAQEDAADVAEELAADAKECH